MHPGVNLGKSIAIDVLHDVYLGVMKLLMGYWFDRQRTAVFTSRYSVCTCPLLCNDLSRILQTAGIMPGKVAVSESAQITRRPGIISKYKDWKGICIDCAHFLFIIFILLYRKSDTSLEAIL